MLQNFWTVVVVIKIILFGILSYYVYKVRKSLDTADATKIKDNFRKVELLTYTIVLFTYGMFMSKFFKGHSNKKKIHTSKKYKGISHVNMALVLVLLAFVSQARAALNVAEKGPVALSFLSDNFRLTEKLAYVLLGFNVITSGVTFMFDNYGDKISDMSHKMFSRTK